MQQTFNHSSGQSLGEYALAGALVAVVGIGACMAVVDIVANTLPSLIERGFGGGGGSLHVDLGGASSAASSSEPIATGSPHLSAKPQAAFLANYNDAFETGGRVCVDANTCVKLPNPEQIAVETAGGLGETELVARAKVLSQLADELEATGEDDQLAKLIRQLANKGHTVGDTLANISANESVTAFAQKNPNPNYRPPSMGKPLNNSQNQGPSDQARHFDYIKKQNTALENHKLGFVEIEQRLNSYLERKNVSSNPRLSAIATIVQGEADQIRSVSSAVNLRFTEPKTENVVVKTGNGQRTRNEEQTTDGGVQITVHSDDARKVRKGANTICDQQDKRATCNR